MYGSSPSAKIRFLGSTGNVRIGEKNGSCSGGGVPELIGVADPGPVEDRADEEDRPIPRFELAQPRRHPVDSIGALAGQGRRNRGQERGREQPRAHALERVGVGKRAGDRHEPRRLQVDELARDPLAARGPQGGDHALAGVDRHVAEAGLGSPSESPSAWPVSASTWTTTEIRGSCSMAASTSS